MAQAPSRTLFVADIPEDVEQGDFKAAFGTCDGFVTCRVRKDRLGKPVGFVDFDTEAQATQARSRFSNWKFRPTDPRPLDIRYAKPSRTAGESRPERADRSDAPRMPRPPHHPGNPTDSLYLENVPSDAKPRELSHIFRPFRGFVTCRQLEREGKNTLTFVEFESAEFAMVALQTVGSYEMVMGDPSSALRISFAKHSSHSGPPRGQHPPMSQHPGFASASFAPMPQHHMPARMAGPQQHQAAPGPMGGPALGGSAMAGRMGGPGPAMAGRMGGPGPAMAGRMGGPGPAMAGPGMGGPMPGPMAGPMSGAMRSNQGGGYTQQQYGRQAGYYY